MQDSSALFATGNSGARRIAASNRCLAGSKVKSSSCSSLGIKGQLVPLLPFRSPNVYGLVANDKRFSYCQRLLHVGQISDFATLDKRFRRSRYANVTSGCSA